MKKGILLVNTGSPQSCEVRDVKKYLSEFLMDERVIDIARWKRILLVKGIIVPFRAKKSAALYRKIWTEQGSPLIHISEEVCRKLSKHTGKKVYSAMRYGNPSIRETLGKMAADNITHIILIPMFPHYAMSTFESVIEKVKNEYAKYGFQNLHIVQPYYNHPDYIKALADNAAEYITRKTDAVIFSYHSLPLTHIRKKDQSGKFCLVNVDCCNTANPIHAVCYRAQSLKTTELLAKKLKVPESKVHQSFQSAMNPDTWLGPDTETTLVNLAKTGAKNIVVICPGFVTDNLETLEEIQIRGKETFLKHGGKEYVYVPALNASDSWIKTLAGLVRNAT